MYLEMGDPFLSIASGTGTTVAVVELIQQLAPQENFSGVSCN
jgi:hypothetical protein